MMTIHRFSFTTRQAAQKANVEPHVPLSNFGRHGHWLGVVPRKLPNGRLLWPAIDVYQALGVVPLRPFPTAADRFRDRLVRLSGADHYQAHMLAQHLHSEAATGGTPRGVIDDLIEDVDGFVHLQSALDARLRNAMAHESDMTNDDWAKLNAFADEVERGSELLCTVLRWVSTEREDSHASA